jgi:hypothetical protein
VKHAPVGTSHASDGQSALTLQPSQRFVVWLQIGSTLAASQFVASRHSTHTPAGSLQTPDEQSWLSAQSSVPPSLSTQLPGMSHDASFLILQAANSTTAINAIRVMSPSGQRTAYA